MSGRMWGFRGKRIEGRGRSEPWARTDDLSVSPYSADAEVIFPARRYTMKVQYDPTRDLLHVWLPAPGTTAARTETVSPSCMRISVAGRC